MQVDSNNDGSPNKFVTAAQVDSSEYLNVVAVKIGLLISSSNDVLDTNVTRQFTVLNESAIEFADTKKVRKLFSTSIAIANHPGV